MKNNFIRFDTVHRKHITEYQSIVNNLKYKIKRINNNSFQIYLKHILADTWRLSP